jgi:hypothetical protein
MPQGRHATDEWTPERIREDRVASFYGRAFVGVQDAARILGKGYPHSGSDREELAWAAESLNAYLAELER